MPDVGEGAHYKYEIRTQTGELRLKADPLAFEAELPPGTNSIVTAPTTLERRASGWRRASAADPIARRRLSIYEVHPARGAGTRSRATAR